MVTIENAYVATAHALNYVTGEYGIKNNYSFGIPILICLFSLYNFYEATTTIKGRLLWSVSNAKTLDGVNFLYVPL